MVGKPPLTLSTVPGSPPGSGRPDPPSSLNAAERKAWRAIVAALPDFWIDGAGELLLKRLCTQIAIVEQLEGELRRLLAEDPGSEALPGLAADHAERAKSIGHLLGLLRATPKSRVVSRSAGSKIAEAPPPAKPWDVRARNG
jgi:hypothetical protein